MKYLACLLAVAVLTGTPAVAKETAKSQSGTQVLKTGLDAVLASAQGNPAPKKDNDQGDDRASDRAKQVVCTKDTPAAQRSAICAVPVSP